MNKCFRLTATAAVLALASTSLMAADQGAFFINGNVGQAHYHDRSFNSSNTDSASTVRVGYDWNANQLSYGVEGGYANLGQASGTVYPGAGVVGINVKTTGWLLGGNGAYRFANHMFISVRAGWFRSTFDANATNIGSASFTGNGAYSGLGVGYDISRHFSLGVNYDAYHGRATVYGTKTKESIGVFSASAEYRF